MADKTEQCKCKSAFIIFKTNIHNAHHYVDRKYSATNILNSSFNNEPMSIKIEHGGNKVHQ